VSKKKKSSESAPRQRLSLEQKIEIELDDMGDAESAGDGKLMAPPPYSDLSLAFGLLEEKQGRLVILRQCIFFVGLRCRS
jgi:hypothetical protein